MERLSDNAIDIIDELMTERLHYFSEYIPLIDAANRLAEYEDLEEQGKLLVLPCKIGDVIYQTRYKCICTLGHTYLHNTCHSPIECRKCRAVKVERWIVETTFSLDMLDRIDKDFFLTREEAEVALNNI